MRLPDACRTFPQRIGYRAGPYFGIWSLEETGTEVADLQQERREEEGVEIDLGEPFPFTRDDLVRCQTRKVNGEERPWLTETWPCPGCIPMCHQGCVGYSSIVVSAEHLVAVLDVAPVVALGGQIRPATEPPGIDALGFRSRELPTLPVPPTFEEWC